MLIPNISDYYGSETFDRLKSFADARETPFLVVDTATVARHYDELTCAFPFADVYYAVKANPAPEIIELLRDRGASFDIASLYELDRVLSLGVTPDRVSYGNTIKKSKDIRYFHERGVTWASFPMACRSTWALNSATSAPGMLPSPRSR